MNDLRRDDLDEGLKRAVSAVLSEPVPQESLERTMGTALRWDRAPAGSSSSSRDRFQIPVVLAIVVLFLLGIGVHLLMSGGTGDVPPNDGVPKSTGRGGLAFSETGARPAPLPFRMPIPRIRTWVADATPVIVATGPEERAKLGQKVAHQDVGANVAEDMARLHVWDWSRSNVSRVMLVKKSDLGSVLSPDGKVLLGPTGKAIEIATGKTLQYKGFDVPAGRRLSHMWFSPSGRYVAALIHLRSETERVQLDPPLFSTRHWWSLRVIERATGRIVDEFPAARLPASAFSPDEASIIYANPENGVARRDLRTHEDQMQYEPAFGARAVVGMALSGDGRFVAAGHYDGEVFVWETQSGKLVLHHRFRNDNGGYDRFFQPRLLQFSADARLLAMGSDNRLKILELESGRIVARHDHQTTPVFCHLRWSDQGERVILVAPAAIGELAAGSRFPAKVQADFLPQVYEWEWRAGAPSPKVYLP